jgi:hypothetical protein
MNARRMMELAAERAHRLVVVVTAASFAAFACGDSARPGARDGAAGGAADSADGPDGSDAPSPAASDAAGAEAALVADAEGDLTMRSDTGDDARPECPALTPLRLSDPRIVTGKLAPGQMATLEITFTNTGDADYSRYPGASLASSTPGVTFVTSLALAGRISAKEVRPLQWTVRVAASVATGTVVPFMAKVVGAGAMDCPGSQTLNFSLTVE